MKRSPVLIKLSREHHTALVLALRIARATDPADLAALGVSVPVIFQDELEVHFQEEENGLLPELAAAGASDLVTRTPVSYTHLDVYKRQDLPRPRLDRRAGKMCRRKPSTAGGRSLRRSDGTVSYTHLDVYKRQHLERLKPGEFDENSRSEAIISACKEVGPALFFSLLIITVSFLPVFTLEAQEGRLFARCV